MFVVLGAFQLMRYAHGLGWMWPGLERWSLRVARGRRSLAKAGDANLCLTPSKTGKVERRFQAAKSRKTSGTLA